MAVGGLDVRTKQIPLVFAAISMERSQLTASAG